MAEQAIISTEKQGPHGTVEGVPSRSGVGRNPDPLKKPTDDLLTDKRRAHYGEDPKSEIKSGEEMSPIAFDVNQILSKANPTRDERIRGDNSDIGHETGFGRHMCQ